MYNFYELHSPILCSTSFTNLCMCTIKISNRYFPYICIWSCIVCCSLFTSHVILLIVLYQPFSCSITLYPLITTLIHCSVIFSALFMGMFKKYNQTLLSEFLLFFCPLTVICHLTPLGVMYSVPLFSIFRITTQNWRFPYNRFLGVFAEYFIHSI